MKYFKGKEIRHDDESPMESFYWMVAISISIRSLVGGFIYRSNYYIPFVNKELSLFQGWFLYALLSIGNAFLFVFILDMERTFVSSIRYTLIPPFLSGIIFYMQTYRVQIFFIVVFMFVIISVPIVQYIKKLKLARSKGKKLRKLKVFRRLGRESYGYLNNLAIVTLVLFLIAFFFIPSFDGKRTVVSNVKATSYEVPDDSIYTLLDENKEALLVLQDSRWKEASETERMDALQILLNVEISYFKISPLQLQEKEMSEYKAGYYSSEDQIAYICPDYINSDESFDAMETTIHEGRHHYQYETVKYAEENGIDLSAPIYSDIREWKQNYSNYFDKDGEMDAVEYLTYKTQPLESDANQYGYDLTLLIHSYINSWR